MRAVFLDRDGTITKTDGYFYKYEQLDLVEDLAEAIKIMNENFLVILITNQPVVARGLCSEDAVNRIHAKINEKLKKEGAHIDAFYFCPHHPEQHDDVPKHARKYRIGCSCRKPKIGLIEQATKDFDIDVKSSYFIGDSTRDVQTAKNAGCMSILVRTGQAGKDGKCDVEPDFVCENLLEAAKSISQKIKAVILAGGKGERLMPLTLTIPKPMIKIAGKPLLEHQINLLREQGIKEIVLCGSYLVDKIKDYFGGGEGFDVTIYYPDEPEPLGSGGAIKNAEGFLKDADCSLILSGDVMLDDNVNFNKMILFHRSKGGLATVLVRETDHPHDSDILQTDENKKIVKFIGRGQDKYKTANVGIIVSEPGLLDFIPDGISNIEKDIVFKLIDKENIYAFSKPDNWFIKDVGISERLKEVKRHFFDEELIE